ncbi:MAG: DUF1028 domain-containing protein [Actinomycetota bacterium]|nr:DUF1028 domain-containing protein [Actinomycetota bacterium]
MTFSIVAWDSSSPAGPRWGVAVASKFLAVGAIVPWARSRAGAVATQSFANLSYGIDGLNSLAFGEDADLVVRTLTEADEDRATRQLGIVDSYGRAASFTGEECFEWAGHRVGDGFCCQGNILTGPEVVDAMVASFGVGGGSLAERLVKALAAGDEKGGDRRGKQSAAVLVVGEGAGYGGKSDTAVDLRVDDHREPVRELGRLLDLHALIFPDSSDLEFIDVDPTLAGEIRELLQRLAYDPGPGTGYDAKLRQTLFRFVGTENLEERWTDEERVEKGVFEFLRRKASEP